MKAKHQYKESKDSKTDLIIEKGLYQTLENSSQAGIYVVQDGKFRFVNQHMANYWAIARKSSWAWNP